MRTLRPFLIAFVLLTSVPAAAQVSFEQPPINYLKATPDDPVTRLQKKIDVGEAELKYDHQHGYLESVLEHLGVAAESQTLVFSKTSFQLRRISPRSPRAIYFNDDVYVGCVRGGDVLEFSAVDPYLGANFYTLDQRETARPQLRRQTYECLQCHGSTLTSGVPGHLVRSVYPAPDGQPILRVGTHRSDHSSPLIERWGGWYVTGQHGGQRHLGNLLVRQSDDPDHLDTEKGANVLDLSPYFDVSEYLTPHSDIVALMVLEHQVNMHNRITKANFSTQMTLRDAKVMNEMLERPTDYESESTKRRITSAGEPLVRHLLFVDEIKLSDPITGTSGFADQFASSGPRDKQGRSLREFDLTSRLFKYPCSYLIYSEAFDRLPITVKDYVYQRLWDVLTEKDTSDEFQHLTSADRQAILEILRDTKKDLPAYWRT